MSDYNQGFPPPGDQGGQGPGQPGSGQFPPQGAPYGQQQPPPQQNPYDQQVPNNAGFGGPGGGSNNNAMIALGLSIGGVLVTIFVALCCVLLAPIPIIMSGIGTYLGHTELTKIDQGAADPSQRGIAQAARIVGIIGIVLPLMALGLSLIFFGATFYGSGV